MKTFHFEGNECWGKIDSERRLRWLLAMYIRSCHGIREEAIRVLEGAFHLKKSACEISPRPTNPMFGLYGEYTDPPRLGNWMRENGIEWPEVQEGDEQFPSNSPYNCNTPAKPA